MMESKLLLVLSVCLSLVFASLSNGSGIDQNAEADKIRIAVIGGGIGGTSTAYYLRDLFDTTADLTVFEKDVVGGRLATVFIEGVEYEIGGSIIHPRNMYMKKFAEEFGFKEGKEPEDETMGIYDGEEFLFWSSPYTIINILKLLWRYGLDVFRMNLVIDGLFKDFERIYELQDAGHSYSTIEGVLDAMGGEDFVKLLSVPIGDVLKEKGFSDRFINELLELATRANYGQDADMMGFAGLVSIAGAMPGLWSVEGGNKRVPEEFLKRSEADLVKSEVRSVERLNTTNGDKPVYKVSWVESGGSKVTDADFDIVVLAVPLQDPHVEIEFVGFDVPAVDFVGEYRRTVATLIQGQPRSMTFGLEPDESVPDSVITNRNIPLNVRTLSKIFPVDYDPSLFEESDQVYKVFSTAVLNKTQMGALFKSRSQAVHRDWLAYPYYRPRANFPGFVLAEGVFYPNAIEWAASAMEMAIIGGRNTALLAHEYRHGNTQQVRRVSDRRKQEL